jgi:rod shape-determining protein MreD
VLIYLAIGSLSAYLYRNFYAESVVIPLSAIGVSSLAYNFIVYILTYLLRGKIEFFYYLIVVILPEITYTVVVAVLLYRLYIVYSHFIDDYEKEKRKGDGDLYEGDL